MSVRITPAGWVFLGLVALLYGASITSQSGLLLAPAGIILGCFAVNLVSAWRAVRRLEVIAPGTAHVVEGQRLNQPWQVRNAGKFPVAFIAAESAASRLFKLPQLAAGEDASVVPELQFHRRGVFAHDRLRLATAFPFGLVKVARRLALAGEVVVHPAVYPVSAPRAAGFDVMVGGKFRGHRQTGAGDQFSGVRPHQAGDSLRQIHWASSAKGLGLMVKVFDEELSGRVAVVLDCGSSGDAKVFDDAVRAAGSLVFAALDAGHHVEWLDLAVLEPDLIPPFADGHEILDRLARLPIEPRSVDRERLRGAFERLSVKSAVHLVLTQASPAASEAVAELRRRGRSVSVYLPAKVPERENFADAPVWRFSGRSMEEVA
ncbi:MAG: hypothetical protein FD161_2683 [Limisphaerales bacterium]|nr:MAG: hypothetical protein FD161_2683 [Limisphaerales bacterium]KAG0508411.1 MAG: hypothetical protein E1N63_2434 [Limisphaerales bacterium]TXT49885.1 MAG: hypothetical protein FD140_2749 [Limisphaerales bacterium]